MPADLLPRARRRLVAALCVSVLVHAAATSLKPGAMRRGAEAPRLTPVSVTLRAAEPEPPPPSVAAPPERTVAIEPRPRPAVRPAPRHEAPAAQAGPSEIPDPTYYGARQLDIYPVPATELALRRPAAVDAKGHVLLLVLIDAHGAVDEVSVVEAQPPGLFDDHAKRTFQAVRFKPALKNGRAVKSRLLVNVSYGESAP